MKLYKKDAKGQVRVWEIEIDYDEECLVITHGVEGGEIQEKLEFIEEGKAGRDVYEQLESRCESRINKKLDLGYVSDKSQMLDKALNVLGLPKPMLAHKSDNHKHKINFNKGPVFVQRKYDGHRCLIAKTKRGFVAYSRNGKIINTIDFIKDQLESLNLTHGMILDGELYHHRTPLQTIGSWVKRKQKETHKLTYVIYDMISENPFQERLSYISLKINWQDLNNIIIAPTMKINSIDEAYKYLSKYRQEGYEGLILRHSDRGYEDGKRSKSLLKFKEWHDAEFVVNSISESKDGWAILNCATKNGTEFSVSAPGTMQEKHEVYRNREEYVGMSVNVQYAMLTVDGMPFHPIATAWRESGE